MTPENYPVLRVLLIASFAHLAVLSCAVPTVAVSPELIATLLDGQQITGELVGWQTEKLTLKSDAKSVELPVDRLLSIRQAEAPRKEMELPVFVELSDGALLPMREFSVSQQEATIGTPLSAEPLSVSTELIKSVQFSPMAQANAKFWSELSKGQLSGDALLVRQGDQDRVDSLTGVLGDISASVVLFTWDGETIRVKRTKVVALAYYQGNPPEWPLANCWLTTDSGARLPAAEIQWNAATESLDVKTVAGVELSLPWHNMLQADYSIGKLTYLSDLDPLQAEWTPLIDLPASAELIRGFGLPRRDQSYSSSSLSLLWPAVEGTAGPRLRKNYAKGLAIRSRTILEYRIPAGMNRLVAWAGIDPATAGQGNVTLEISADDSVLWQGEIDGGDPPVEINVSLPQARRLRLVVDYGGNLDYGDRLHLIEARMSK
jgi:hypothetical protein